MAVRECRELYSNAEIDCSDMTLTEYRDDGIQTYSILDILKHWDGVHGIEIEIRQRLKFPACKKLNETKE